MSHDVTVKSICLNMILLLILISMTKRKAGRHQIDEIGTTRRQIAAGLSLHPPLAVCFLLVSFLPSFTHCLLQVTLKCIPTIPMARKSKL
jgi:hypothetical protein